MKWHPWPERGRSPELQGLDIKIKQKRQEIQELPGLLRKIEDKLSKVKIGQKKPDGSFYAIEDKYRYEDEIGRLRKLPGILLAQLLTLLKRRQKLEPQSSVDSKTQAEIDSIAPILQAECARLEETIKKDAKQFDFNINFMKESGEHQPASVTEQHGQHIVFDRERLAVLKKALE